MKINDLCGIQIGTQFKVIGPVITRELVGQFAQVCGFGSTAHVKGDRSVFSLGLGTEPVVCLHGAGTLCLLNAALEKVFAFDEPYDVISYRYGEKVEFGSPNMEGGTVEFTFTVLKVEASRFPLRKIRKSVPGIDITFACEAVNSRTGKKVMNLNWDLCYIAMSDLDSL